MGAPASRPDARDTLFVSDTEIAARLGIGYDRWKRLRPVLEQRGLPKPDPLIGRRYWPAVRTFLDRRAGIDRISASAVDDGEVNHDALR